jgi:hypothetical protein
MSTKLFLPIDDLQSSSDIRRRYEELIELRREVAKAEERQGARSSNGGDPSARQTAHGRKLKH